MSLPVGAYRRFDVAPPCGLAGFSGIIGDLDSPDAFNHRQRGDAQLLWFKHGFVEYPFSLRKLDVREKIRRVEFSAELCSDASGHDLQCQSDITLSLQGKEFGVWTSPSDYGGTRGQYTPSWWHIEDTQFGDLTRWIADSQHTEVNGFELPLFSLENLRAVAGEFVVRIGVKPNARNSGGLNLFGEQFGNHPQALTLQIDLD